MLLTHIFKGTPARMRALCMRASHVLIINTRDDHYRLAAVGNTNGRPDILQKPCLYNYTAKGFAL